MVDLAWFREFLNPFGWFLKLGKEDTDHIKGEVQDLIQHSSQSLRSLIELSDALEEIPKTDFTKERFWPIANYCFWFFTSPEGVQKARTHCTDIDRDVARINFKMAKVLRTENLDWKGISDAFSTLLDADTSFLYRYEGELTRIRCELTDIGDLLEADESERAWEKYEALRTSLLSSKQAPSDEISRMQAAQTHIHKLLT